MIEPLVAFSSIRQKPHPLARHSLTADLTNWPPAPSQENLLSKFFCRNILWIMDVLH